MTNVVTVSVTAIALLMVLREVQVDIAPVLTGAGIVGLAVGFGAQTLVRDIISGFFLILEDQVRVGDVAAINGTGGLVEAINLRTIVLRDVEGTVHVFPNGAIQTLANRSKDFSYYVIDLGISYRENPDRVAAVLREVGADLQADPVFAPWILMPVEVLGVDAFADSAVIMKMRIRTMPLKQWEVGREFRRRLKMRLDREGIEIPFPQRVVSIRPEREGAQ
ncbi:MAG: mechanosensitive ion channel family protein [Acidobacteria bacterium]|nr:mechanosensitive ion channel family protein [Acidobacteriota bacterium]